ncbi:alpha/beta fold hydrolase [Ruegeria marina]|uniref:DNA-binding winged helix-turn-helix (WHTH) domain-containing protein n=1 Tax=Ruegeria marina TaxID=639004 RepID=A0A1G7AW31_9RHOB|nr:alpha/beta fold hydrolase [Ruegeria marina]SDE18166.1 DNA-binding winged helix-turn-helix (wHTH) domain-containing protein [Ruegeria marina]
MRYAFSDCVLDAGRHVLMRGGAPVATEPQVFDLLHLLVRNPGRLVSRDEILAEVWNGRIVSESAIGARIAAARKAVGDDGKRQAIIRTVARRGLQIVTEVAVQPDGAPLSAPAESTDAPRIRYLTLPTGHSRAYSVSGAGAPVILIGQTRSDIAAEWRLPFERHRFEALSRRNTLIRFDTIGAGQSDPRPDRSAISEQADDTLRLADALGLDRFALYSQSGGCAQALCIAAQYPERVTRLAMMGAYAEGRAVRDGAQGKEAEPLRAMLQTARSRPDSTFFEAFLLAYQPEGPLDSVRAYARMMLDAASREHDLRHRDVINHHSSLQFLPRITCPTLILHSRHDAVHPLSEARKLAAGIAGAEMVVLECANHVPWQGNAAYDTYLETLTRFLAAEAQ